MSEYIEGILNDGAVILKDGVPITIAELLRTLNSFSTIERETAEKCAALVNDEQLVENLDCPEDSAYSRAIDCATSAITSNFNLGETP